MEWKLWLLPVVGAIIGYATNWIAVKMLFRPRHEIRILGRRLPFTPGVIPKGQERLANAAGRVVKDHLLNHEIMRSVLLSDRIRKQIIDGITDWKAGLGDANLHECIGQFVKEETIEQLTGEIEDRVSDHLCRKILSMDPASMLVEKLMEEVREMLNDSMFGMMIGGSLLDKIGEQIRDRADRFIQDHLEEYIRMMVHNESESIMSKSVTELIERVENESGPMEEAFWNLYCSIVENHLDGLLEALDFSSIVKDRINEMPVEEVETLVLYVMEKELAAVVNIGAVIGFVLGLANILIIKLF